MIDLVNRLKSKEQFLKVKSKVVQYSQYGCVSVAIGIISVSAWHNYSSALYESVKATKVFKAIDKARTKEVIVEVLIPPPPQDKEVTLISNYIRNRNSKLSFEIAEIISSITVKTAKEHDIPVELLVGIIEKESLFNPMATTKIVGKQDDYAKGLMQVYQGEGIDIIPDQVYDISYNLKMGCTILNKKIALNYGNMDNALRNYSGNAEGYTGDVLSNVGRYTIYKWKAAAKEAVASVSMQ